MDLLATTDSDLDITGGDLSWVTGIEAVRQNVEMGLRTWLAESPYGPSVGVPYIQIIFQRGANVHGIREILKFHILSHDGVTEVIELNTSIDTVTRTFTVTGRAKALDEEFPIDVEVTAS